MSYPFCQNCQSSHDIKDFCTTKIRHSSYMGEPSAPECACRCHPDNDQSWVEGCEHCELGHKKMSLSQPDTTACDCVCHMTNVDGGINCRCCKPATPQEPLTCRHKIPLNECDWCDQKPPQECKHCGGDIKIRNPKGYCDHLYYPESCEVCTKPSPSAEREKAVFYSEKWGEAEKKNEKLYAALDKIAIQSEFLSNIPETALEGLRSRNEMINSAREALKDTRSYSDLGESNPI